jgi:hypothetical protein
MGLSRQAARTCARLTNRTGGGADPTVLRDALDEWTRRTQAYIRRWRVPPLLRWLMVWIGLGQGVAEVRDIAMAGRT